MFHPYLALIGYFGINYFCIIDSRRKEYAFNQFFLEHGEDTSGYTPKMIRDFLKESGILHKEFFLIDPSKPEDRNMRMFGIWLGQVWTEPDAPA